MKQYNRYHFDNSVTSKHVYASMRSLPSKKSMKSNASQVLETSPIKVLLALLHVNLEEILSLPIDGSTKFKLKNLDAWFSRNLVTCQNGEDKL